MKQPRTRIILTIVLIAAGIAINFDGLLLHLNTALPGTPGEGALWLTHTWWPGFSLTVPDGLSIHSYIGAPFLNNHLLAMPLLQAMVFALLQPIGGPVLAFNLVLIALQIGTQLAFTAYLQSKRLPPVVALIGAAAFVISPWYSTTIGQANIVGAAIGAIPLALLAWDRWLDNRSTWRAILVILSIWGAVLCGVQYLVLLLIVWLPYAIWHSRDIAEANRKDARRQMAIMALTMIALLAIYPLPNIVRTLQGFERAYSPAFNNVISRSVPMWIIRTGPLIVLAAVAGIVLSREVRNQVFWTVVGGSALIMGLGLLPDPLHIVLRGIGVAYTPLADQWMLIGGALIALLMIGCTAAGKWWSETESVRWKWIAGITAVVLIFGTNLPGLRSMPTQPVEATGFYREIAGEPEDYIVLEYPFGAWSASDGERLGDDASLMLNAVWHHKRTLSIAAPYIEEDVFEQLERDHFLNPIQIGDQMDRASDQLARAVNERRIGYVVVHPELVSTGNRVMIDELAAQSGALCAPFEQDGLIIYRARWHPAGCR
ncbi:MAG: hypothetical protein JXJ17_18290 [Anaerolineae bacterium]|nr:hypothetical protein [Anaerolineae bacterium]